MRNVSRISCRGNQNTFIRSKTFFRKSRRLRDEAEKYGTAGQATDENRILRMRTSCSIIKATDIYSETKYLSFFPHSNNRYAKVPQF